MIARRVLMTGAGLGLLAGPAWKGFAQTRRARVGLLSVFALPPPGERGPYALAFLARMQERGWTEASNLTLEVRGAAPGKPLAAAASELIALRPDVLVTSGTPAVILLRDLTTEIPIVMDGAGDPVGTGLVASLARPGGNVTGVSWQLQELIPKTLSYLHEIVPHARRVDFMNQINDPGNQFFANVMREAAQARGLDCRVREVGNPDGLVAEIFASNADAMLMLATGMIYRAQERIAAAAIQRRLPLAITGGPGRALVMAGLLFCYCANDEEMKRRVADCVDRILRGTRPADIPVAQPQRYDFVINQTTARELGLTLPRALLLRADEVIE
jgi:putative tryptophan/tyrosine transport system substrate-binding protein